MSEDFSMSKYPKIDKPWKLVGTSSIETHDGEMHVTIHGGNQVNPWTLQMICDGVNTLARSWFPDDGRFSAWALDSRTQALMQRCDNFEKAYRALKAGSPADTAAEPK